MALRLCLRFSELPAQLLGQGLLGLPKAATCCSSSLNFTDYIRKESNVGFNMHILMKQTFLFNKL